MAAKGEKERSRSGEPTPVGAALGQLAANFEGYYFGRPAPMPVTDQTTGDDLIA